jgi:predicted nucleic acid-binding protein
LGLRQNLGDVGSNFRELTVPKGVVRSPSAQTLSWLIPLVGKLAARTTDAHLLAVASRHDAKLVTLDTGIPDAFVVPA